MLNKLTFNGRFFSRIEKMREASGGCRDICPCHVMGFAHNVHNFNKKDES